VEAFVITLREGFEASLIVGLVVAFLAKTGQDERYTRFVWVGVAAAVVASVIAGGILFATMGELEGDAEVLFEGSAMVVASAVLTWMVFWMRRQSASIGRHIRAQVSDAVRTGSTIGLVGIVFVAVAREGVETALFLFAATNDSNTVATVVTGILGLFAAVVLGLLLYRGAVAIDLRKFFAVTGVLVILISGYLLFSGLHEFGEVGGGEALEAAGAVLAILYCGGFSWLYLRALRPHAAST
jgi:high-affinity iron transporter